MTDTGEPTELEDVIIIGTVAVPGGPKPGGGGGGGTFGGINANELTEEPTAAPDGVWTPEEAEDENARQAECAAKKFGEEVQSLGSRGEEVEHFSVTWKKDGNNVTSEIREATGRNGNMPIGSAVSSTDFNSLSGAYGGIPLSQITGFNHSHAADIYCNGTGLLLQNQRRDNQRPSDNDWDFADALTNSNPGHGLVLYLRDCEGAIRAFPYADNQAYRNGSRPTPDPISPSGCDDAG